jgi:hypothetical protein
LGQEATIDESFKPGFRKMEERLWTIDLSKLSVCVCQWKNLQEVSLLLALQINWESQSSEWLQNLEAGITAWISVYAEYTTLHSRSLRARTDCSSLWMLWEIKCFILQSKEAKRLEGPEERVRKKEKWAERKNFVKTFIRNCGHSMFSCLTPISFKEDCHPRKLK